MVSQPQIHANEDLHNSSETLAVPVPIWSKIFEPIVALIILWILYCAATQIFV
ncbi:hypothetical protein D3C72_2226860 [compost metagenome]